LFKPNRQAKLATAKLRKNLSFGGFLKGGYADKRKGKETRKARERKKISRADFGQKIKVKGKRQGNKGKAS
jgi:hypothetical protein